MKTMKCRSKCKSRIYNVDIIVVGELGEVQRFICDNTFINDLSVIKCYYYNSPVANPKSRVRAARTCGGMQSAARPTKEPCR